MRRLVKIVLILMGSALVSATFAAAQSDDLAALRSRVSQLHAQGKYAEAIPIAERYVAAARKLMARITSSSQQQFPG